jgi:hypothetical protein
MRDCKLLNWPIPTPDIGIFFGRYKDRIGPMDHT